MATINLTYDIVAGTEVQALPLQTNFQEIENYLNSSVIRTDGSVAMAASTQLLLGGDATSASAAATKSQTEAYTDAAITALDSKVWNTANYAALSVTTAKIADDAVTSAKLGPNSVDAAAIGPSVVSSSHLGSNAVTTAKIATDAVTNAKIGLKAVEGDNIGKIYGFDILDASISVVSAGNLDATFDVENYDEQAFHAASSTQANVPTGGAGYYLLTAYTSNSFLAPYIRLNGGASSNNIAVPTAGTAQVMRYLADGDNLRVNIINGSGSTEVGSVTFTAVRIGTRA